MIVLDKDKKYLKKDFNRSNTYSKRYKCKVEVFRSNKNNNFIIYVNDRYRGEMVSGGFDRAKMVFYMKGAQGNADKLKEAAKQRELNLASEERESDMRYRDMGHEIWNKKMGKVWNNL